MAHQRGEVVLVPFPFTDLRGVKVRPAVVVSSLLYHATEPDLLPAAVTSNLVAATGPLDHVLTDWKAAGLRFPSAFKPVLFTLDPARVVHTIGALAPADLVAVDQRLRLMLQLV